MLFAPLVIGQSDNDSDSQLEIAQSRVFQTQCLQEDPSFIWHVLHFILDIKLWMIKLEKPSVGVFPSKLTAFFSKQEHSLPAFQ